MGLRRLCFRVRGLELVAHYLAPLIDLSKPKLIRMTALKLHKVDPRISSNVTDQYVVGAGSGGPDVSDQDRVEWDHTNRISKPDQLHGSYEADQRTGAGMTRESPFLSQGHLSLVVAESAS